MLKLFRKIRQNHLLEGKTAKYFKYAIDEIILVVIGILIALQLNNSSERKKEHKKEQAFLKEINLDFKSNKAQLDSIVDYNSVSLNATTSVLEAMVNFDLKKYYTLVWRNKSYNPKNGTIEALKT